MQGRNQFQGQATSNMDFPTEAYVSAHGQAYRDVGQAYAKAAQIESEAKQKMAGDLAQGALGGFGAYQKGIQAEKNFTAGRAMLKSPFFQKILGINPGEAADYGSYLDKIKKDQGVDAANSIMGSSLGSIMKYAQGIQDFERQKQLIDLRTQGAMDVAGLRASTKEQATWRPASSKDIFPDESDGSSTFDPTDLGFGNNFTPTFRATKNFGVR